MKFDGFEWDDGNWPKCGRHGVSRAEIEAVFTKEPAVYADPGHSLEEQRLRAIGRNSEGRYVFVAFTIRSGHGRRYVRPVSARYMRDREVRHYEQRQET